LILTLTLFQRDVLGIYPLPRLFAVVSWGCAGTAWLARALNSHPEVFCVHALSVTWRIFVEAPPTSNIDSIDYMRLVGAQGHAHAVAGDVHGVSRHTIPALQEEFGETFRVAVLVRDPLPRLRSQLALMERLKMHRGWGDLTYVDEMAQSRGLDPRGWNYTDRLRFHAVNMLNSIIDEMAIGAIYKMEEVVSRKDVLLELFDHLTAGLSVPTWWADYVQRLAPINSHARTANSASLDVTAEFLRQVVRPEARDRYRSLGYAVNF
jgi:hypothetical protein